MTARGWLAGVLGPGGRRRLAVLAVLAVAAGLVGCGVPTDPAPHTVTAPDPFRMTDPPRTGDITEGPVLKTLFLTQDRLVVKVFRPAERAPTPEELLNDLTDGPTPSELNLGLSSALAGVVFEEPAVSIDEGVITVDLGDGLAGLAGDRRILAYAQIVCTLYELPGVGGVLFSQSGEPVPVPNGEGTSTAGPLTPDDYATVLAPA